LSEYGVPDDDMSDSLPADGGPDPYDGRDLQRLLSGEDVPLPEGMRRVARTLDALRAAPLPAELAGEASARAAFRQIMLAGNSGPASSGSGADGAHTLILPTRARGAGPRAVTRPRHAHRRPRQRGRWQPKALAGAAAAAVIVGGIALAGTFSGAAGHPRQAGRTAGATSPAPESGRANSNGLEGNASKEPTPRPTASQSTAGGPDAESEAKALCRQYLGFIMHHESRSDWAAEGGTYDQLSNLAGGSWRIVGYCVDLEHPWAMSPKGPGSYYTGPGVPPPGDSQFGAPQGSQGENRLKDQQVGNGPGENAGNGGNGNSSGGQGRQ
jgi:hypothetical protein